MKDDDVLVWRLLLRCYVGILCLYDTLLTSIVNVNPVLVMI